MSENILFFDLQFIWLFFGNWLSNPGAQLGGEEWGGIPCPFLKIENIGLILEKKALIVSICGLSFPFKM